MDGIYDRYGTDVHTLEQVKIVLSGKPKQAVG
jgi:hypothetical protein